VDPPPPTRPPPQVNVGSKASLRLALAGSRPLRIEVCFSGAVVDMKSQSFSQLVGPPRRHIWVVRLILLCVWVSYSTSDLRLPICQSDGFFWF